jgi:hypothetical protein
MTTKTRPTRVGIVEHERSTRGQGTRDPEKALESTRWSDREGQGDPEATAVEAKANEPEAPPVLLPRAD